MGKNYTGPRYFYGNWLSLGRLFFLLHINNQTYNERHVTDLFRFYIGWDTPRGQGGKALYPIFELRWATSKDAFYLKTNKPAIEFCFQFLNWHYLNGPCNFSYNIFGKRRSI